MSIRYLIKEARYYRKVTGLSRAIKKFLLTETPFSSIVNGKIYGKIYRNIISKKSQTSEPRILQIENTNICNATCIMCPHRIMKRKQRIMNQSDFEKIIDNVMGSYKIKRLNLNGFGEPFIDKGIFEKIRYVNKKYPALKIDLYTNASLLTPEVSDNILSLNIARIIFSVNGTRDNYNKIMGLDYDSTMKNIKYFFMQKKKMGTKILTHISLMILDDNKSDVDRFIKYWAPKADSVRTYAPNNWAGSLKDIVYKTPFKKDKRWPCFFLWNLITVNVEGEMKVCNKDYESSVVFGNLINQSARDIRESEMFKSIQKAHMCQDFNSPLCNTCDIRFESSIDWIC